MLSPFSRHKCELVVDLDRIVLEPGVEWEHGLNLLALLHLGGDIGRRLAVQFLDALGEHLGMTHLIDGDELDLERQFPVVHVIKVVVLVHILVDRVQLHGACLVEHLDNLGPFRLFGIACHVISFHNHQ